MSTIAGYSIGRYRYVAPNPRHKNKDKWSKDWIGYLEPIGKYWRKGMGKDTTALYGYEVSIVRTSDGNLRPDTIKGRVGSTWTPMDIPEGLGGNSQFFDMVNALLHTIDIDSMRESIIRDMTEGRLGRPIRMTYLPDEFTYYIGGNDESEDNATEDND